MPSFKTLSAILAVSGMASAMPQASFGRFTNTTTPAGTGPVPNGAITVGADTFNVEADTIYSGQQLNLGRKRATDNSGLRNCLATCSESSECVGTAYDQNAETCSYFGSIVPSSKKYAAGVTFATVTSRNGKPVDASAGTGSASPSGSRPGSAQPSGSMGSGSGSGSGVGAGAGAGGVNGTSPGSGNGSGANSTGPVTLNDKFCPSLNLDIVLSRTGLQFKIECGKSHFGTVIDIVVDLTKRAAPQSLDDCMDLCSQNAECTGTAFDTVGKTCTLFSDVQAAYDAPGVEFATRVNEGTEPVTAGQGLTSTIYSTNVVTISSCAPTVTNCPLKNGNVAVVTEIVPVASTVYVCPVASSVPAAPIGCTGCPYVASTATVYSSSGSSMVPVSTQVFNAPQPTGTIYSTITVACPTCPAATVPATAPATAGVTTVCPTCPAVTAPATTPAPTAGNYASASACNGSNCPAAATSSMAVFMGAAGQVKAGMGMVAVVAGAVFMI